MQTDRCHRCGQVLGAYVTVAPGIALPFASHSAGAQVEARRAHHLERCPVLLARASVRAGGERTRAIVVGASMAGLLAARVLSEQYDRVTVLDRDRLPATAVPRGGVPHGVHTHGLLAKGREVLAELFPGLVDDLVGDGALVGDVQQDARWILHGAALRRADSDLRGVMMSRALLERRVRARVEALPNVTIVPGQRVTGLLTRAGRVRGVWVADVERPAHADLVVDASGRTSKLPEWLKGMGYPAPREERVHVDVTYTTRHFAATTADLDGDRGMIVAATPEVPRAAAMLRQEGDRWIVSLGAYHGECAPRELAGFLDWASALEPSMGAMLRSATPLDGGRYFRFPASVRRRYDELRSFPEGLLVIGDAVCSFNPVFGQGMTVAALEALALRESIGRRSGSWARRFFTASRPIVDAAWDTSVAADLQLPGTPGRQSWPMRMVDRYVSRFQTAAHDDADLAAAFLRVINMMEPPSSLMRPRYVGRVLAHRPRRGAQAELAPAARVDADRSIAGESVPTAPPRTEREGTAVPPR